MDKAETMQIIKILKTTYSYAFKDFNDDDYMITANVWQSQFNDYPVKAVLDAVYRLISTSRYMPTIADIKSNILENNIKLESSEEAWAKVRTLLSRLSVDGFNEYKKLPQAIQDSIGGYAVLKSWGQLDVNMVDTSIARQFKEAYKTRMIETKQELINGDLPLQIEKGENKDEQKCIDWKIN